MGLKSGDAERTLSAFCDAFLLRRNLHDTAAFLSEKVQWIGIRSGGIVAGKAAVLSAMQENIEVYPNPFLFSVDQLTENLIETSYAVVSCTLTFPQCGGMTLGASASCVWEHDTCQMIFLHVSVFQEANQNGDSFATAFNFPQLRDFEWRINQSSTDILVRNIPGGIIGYYLEPNAPIYFLNDRILALLGYSYAEFICETGDCAYHLLHPVDRDRVLRTVNQALEQDQEYEIQYRMRKRNGDYLWINDIGRRGKAEDGRSICLSVLRDITAEVSAKHALLIESGENEFQARRYDQLFQSVLCGIVQYGIEAGGTVQFKNANREAMRVFGYSPEAFWAKDDWDISLLIAEEDRSRILEEIGHLKEVGDKQSFEYRLLQRDGTPLWIVGSAEIIQDVDGEAIVQSVFMDVDSRKKAEQRNRQLSDQIEASNELLKLALEHTTTCEFYYYPLTKSCIVPPRACAYYGFRPQYQNLPEGAVEDLLTSDSVQAFCQLFDRINHGARTSSEELQLKNGIWCRETLSTISYTEDGRPSLTIGILEDISREKEMEAALQNARSRDTLTGLYNKETGIRLVKDYLKRKSPSESCGLMLLDMDNFEEVNREEGSVFADAILQEVADILRAETGADDYQIRLGGDEFMLFIKNCNKERATIVGPHIAELVSELFHQPEKDLKISVSIGMCVTLVVEEYHALYRCAESTLKYVKEHQKGRAACYLDTSNELGVFLTQLYTEEHQVNEIDRQIVRKEEDLVSFALELLGKSKNLDDAVFLLLARVGKYFHLDRVSILENNREYLSFRFAYQWSRSRATLQLGQIFYLTEEEFDQGANMYDDEGLCDYNINEQVSDISSCLHAGIWNYGEYVGSMSFEINCKNYQWTEEQRKVLKELVKIVPSFLMKAKADAVSQAKTDFLSRMSHEIRTPMNAISGMTTIAKSMLSDKVKVLDCLNKIESANTYLLGLINDILDMSRIESGKLELNTEYVDLAHYLSELESLLKPQALTNQLDFHIENEYVENRPVLADRLRLNQVLVNIIGNAFKFTASGGCVDVRIIPVLSDDTGITLKFSVRDNGIGIEKAAIERIFNAFEQAERNTAAQYGGTGLGLSISSRLVQMMGGVLEVQSEVGEGSEFYFTLSLPFAPREDNPREVMSFDSFDFTGKRILLAEDNELNAEIAQSILEMNGFIVEYAKDGLEALHCFEAAEAEHFDAVLMDIRMPVMDGLESTRRIRTLGKPDSRTIPIIALTANAFDEDSKKSLECGMNGHLSKPLEVDKLLHVLADCIQMSKKNQS